MKITHDNVIGLGKSTRENEKSAIREEEREREEREGM